MNDENTQRHWMVCRGCGYPLEWRPDSPEPWFHIRTDLGEHDVIPVDAQEMDFKQRCDFCDREQATDLVLCHSFMMPGSKSRSVGHWAACEQCAECCRRGRWGALVNCVKRYGGVEAKFASRQFLREIYTRVEINMFGVITLAEWKARGGYPLQTD